MKKVYKSLTNYKTIIGTTVIGITGIALIFFAHTKVISEGYPVISMTIANIGSLLIASVSIALVWELYTKRAFLDELLSTTDLAESIKASGLTGITLSPTKGVDYASLINQSKSLDMYVCYASTWRGSFEEELQILARKPNARVRLIIPNPSNKTLMESLCKRFTQEGTNRDEIKKRIETAIAECKNVFNTNENPSLDFSIWVHDEPPVFSFYRFDQYSTFTLYKHGQGRTNRPTIVAKKGGELYEFIELELKAMISGSNGALPLAHKVYPKNEQKKLE